jgi:hypothetical protein
LIEFHRINHYLAQPSTMATAAPASALRLPLLVVATALVLVLDDTIANIAPSLSFLF